MTHPLLLKSLAVMAAGVFSAGIALSGALEPAAPPQKAEPRLDLSGYQSGENAPVTTFRNGTSADPYFGLYALELARRGGLDIKEAAHGFIEWGIRQQKEDGRFERYCKKDLEWVRCGRADSDDATLARWVHLLYQEGAASMPPAWLESARKAEAALEALKMRNGVYSVFPHDPPGLKGYALFKDNVEVLSVYEALSSQFRKLGETGKAEDYLSRARSLRSAMVEHFGDAPFDMKRLSLGANYARELFYPHAVAIPFGWLEGYYPAPLPKDWDRWLAQYDTAWRDNAQTDFPWGLMALAALQTGRADIAACWKQRYAEWGKADYHWNILEEVALQVIEAANLPTSYSCSPEPFAASSAAKEGAPADNRSLFSKLFAK